VLFLALDRLSFLAALHGIGITPWNPSTGLTMALLIIKGPSCFAIITVAELLSGATLPTVPVSPVAVFVAALVAAGGYTGATALLPRIGFQASLRRTFDLVLLLAVTMVSSGLVASAFVTTYSVAGVIPWAGFAEAVAQFWIGDAIGILVLTPLLLIASQPLEHPAQPHRGPRALRLVEVAAQGASIVAALAAVFWQLGGNHAFEYFYLLFLPLIWIATRRGLTAASWGVLAIQIGLIVGFGIRDQSGAALCDFQLLMFALTTTGLMLGAVVSERCRLSRALSDSERRQATILNTARDGVLTIDAQGRIQSINPAVERLFGHPGRLLVGRDVREFVDTLPDLLSRLRHITSSSGVDATCWELDARRSDGSVFPIELSVGRFDLPGAEEYTLVMRDVTLRQKAEARAREHQAELAHFSRISLAGEMAAGLAHELGQPLTAIAAYGRGCLRLLAGPAPEPAMLYEGMSGAVQQAERAGDILARLREFVRGGPCRRALVEVPPLIDAAVSLARIEAIRHEVEIEARIDPDLPPVLADHIQIEQVMLNLLRNAVDAIETGDAERRSIVVEARRKCSRAIEISVADSGPGVAEELTGKIFESFVTTKPLGMGLGLSISSSIVESHGGSLRLAQNAGSGAIFLFDLPTDGAEACRHAG
jgi:two-component system sensor kinase FixL